MCEVPVFYATTDGQTRLIAEYLARSFRSHGLESVALDVANVEAWSLDRRGVRAVLLGASVHAGKHQSTALTFVAAHRQWLSELPSALFSVSLSIASSNQTEVQVARALAKTFVEQTAAVGCRSPRRRCRHIPTSSRHFSCSHLDLAPCAPASPLLRRNFSIRYLI